MPGYSITIYDTWIKNTLAVLIMSSIPVLDENNLHIYTPFLPEQPAM